MVKTRHKTRKILVVIVIIPIILILTYVVAKPVFPVIVAQYYQAEIKNAYKSFTSFDSDLQRAGVQFEAVGSQPICENGPFSDTSPCDKSRIARNIDFSSSSFQQTWKQTAPTLDKHFTSLGWKRTTISNSNEDVALVNLFDVRTPPYQFEVVYSKKIDRADCEVNFDNIIGYRFDVIEDCSRMGTKTHFW